MPPLKDTLFHRDNVTMIALSIQKAYPRFHTQDFITRTLDRFPELELKQRINHITDMLEIFLGTDTTITFPLLLASLPPALSNDREDGDFGDFIYASYGEYVARHGCSLPLLSESFLMLESLTQRFSMEFAIRPFFQNFPTETLEQCLKWARNTHYHVRRLASEGSRPRLPWGSNIGLDYQATRPILELLYDDPTSCVRRSVANHLNDVIKKHPDYVQDLLRQWKQTTRQPEKFEKMARHATRTLRKGKGHKKSL